jgi:ABC-type dipeptide/oligopeptide/nickel transport system ATPase subunit
VLCDELRIRTARGMGLLVIDHYARYVEAVCDRMVVMEEGGCRTGSAGVTESTERPYGAAVR